MVESGAKPWRNEVQRRCLALGIFLLSISCFADHPMRFYPDSHESALAAKKTPKAIQPTGKGIPKSAQKTFCLNVRGWAIPTQHVFAVFEDVFDKETLDGKGLDTIRFWLDRGFGFALSTLIEEVYPNHFPQFVKLMKIEYKDTNAICPFRCTYRDYVELHQSLSSVESRQQLDALCRPDCLSHKAYFSDYDEDFCECVVNQHSASCMGLSEEDIKVIAKAVNNQKASRRDYEFRSNKNRMNNENTHLIEQRKKALVNSLHNMVAP